MTALLLAALVAVVPQDTSRHSAAPRRVPAIQDSIQDEDMGDRWLAEDKLKHFSMSYGITVFAFASGRMIADHDASAALAIGAGGAAGILKEVYDRTHDKPFSLRDLLWDAAGVAVGYAMIRNAR